MRRLDPSRDALLTLSVLLIVDAAFVLVHVLHDAGKGSGGRLKHERYSLETDRGLAELFGYAKEGLVVIALFFLYRRTRALGYAAWSFAFLITLMDDSFQLHESGGEYLVAHLNLPSVLGLRPLDAGELIVWTVLGVLMLAALAVGHRRSATEVRSHSRRLFLLLAALLFFTVIMDMVHVLVTGTAHGVAAIIEDGGEQIVLSGTVAYVIWIAERHRAIQPLSP